MLSVIAAGISAIGGGIASAQAAKAQKKAANTIQAATTAQAEAVNRLAQPYQDVLNYALPQMKSAVGQYGAQVGKNDPLLAAEHGQNVTDINRAKTRALLNSSRFWGVTGNAGRGRGEALRIGQTATETENRENLSYGGLQRDFRQQALDRWFGATGQLAGIGGQGTNLAVHAAGIQAGGVQTAAGMKADAASSLYGDIGAGLGSISGAYIGDYQMKQRKKMLDRIYGPSGSRRKWTSVVVGG